MEKIDKTKTQKVALLLFGFEKQETDWIRELEKHLCKFFPALELRMVEEIFTTSMSLSPGYKFLEQDEFDMHLLQDNIIKIDDKYFSYGVQQLDPSEMVIILENKKTPHELKPIHENVFVVQHDGYLESLAQVSSIIYQFAYDGVLIAIDGTAGSGKNTIAGRASRQLNARYIDSGLLFRFVTWELTQIGLEPDDMFIQDGAVSALFEDFSFDLLANEEVLKKLRSSENSQKVPFFAEKPQIRKIIFLLQIETIFSGDQKYTVVEGRDITSHVLILARYKFYIDASLELRARRRAMQLTNTEDFWEEVAHDLSARDRRDMEREISPLYFDEARGVKKIFNDGSPENTLNILFSFIEESKAYQNI
jgi:cytidylate kinase